MIFYKRFKVKLLILQYEKDTTIFTIYYFWLQPKH